MAFAYFKISIIGADGRASKPVRVKADVDDPCVGDKLRVAGAWHEVVDVLHMINEQQRPRVADAVVVCAPLLSPPPWLDDIEGDGPCAEASASRDLSMGSAQVLEFVSPRRDGALASRSTIDSELPMRLPDPFMWLGTERATGIHHRHRAMQPRRQSAVPTVVRDSLQRHISTRRKRWRFAGMLVGGAAAVVIGAIVGATATRSDRAGGNESALAMDARPDQRPSTEAPDLADPTATPLIANKATANTERSQIGGQRDQEER